MRMRLKQQEQDEQKQERMQEALAFRDSFRSKQAQADRSKAKQDAQKETLLFPIPKPKAMQTKQPSKLQQETAFQAVQRNIKACKRKLQVHVASSSEEEESEKKVDRSTLADFCKDMSDEDIMFNRKEVPTWGYTLEAARKLKKRRSEKRRSS